MATGFEGQTVTVDKEELFQLLEAVYGQLWEERENWGGEDGENTEDLTALIYRINLYLDKEIYGGDQETVA